MACDKSICMNVGDPTISQEHQGDVIEYYLTSVKTRKIKRVIGSQIRYSTGEIE